MVGWSDYYDTAVQVVIGPCFTRISFVLALRRAFVALRRATLGV